MTDQREDARKAFLSHQSDEALSAEWRYGLDREDELTFAPCSNGRDDDFWVPIHDAIKYNMKHKNIWTDHAFLTRWGTAEELRTRLAAFEALIDWWNERENDWQVEITKGLNAAQVRLWDLSDIAARIEFSMQLRGFLFNPTSHLLVEIKPTKRGPKRSLLSLSIGALFDQCVREGSPKKNTVAIRKKIAGKLAKVFHPDLLDPARGGKIDSAVNAHLNADRSRKKKRKQKSKKGR